MASTRFTVFIKITLEQYVCGFIDIVAGNTGKLDTLDLLEKKARRAFDEILYSITT
jgi:hypothetical protein